MKNRLLLIIIPLIILAVALAGGFTLLWRFFVFLLIVLLLSYLWPRLSIHGINGRMRKSAEHCQAGEYYEEEFTVFNNSRIPAPLIEVSEETNMPGYGNAVTFSLFSQSSHNWRTRVHCQRRGQYRIGALTAKVTDPLGIFARERRLSESQSIIVYPRIIDLPYFQALPRQESGSNPRRWLASETGPNAARVREYTSGDSLRHIHWQTTAHTGKLMVKEFDPDRSHYTFKNIWIILDMNRDMQYGEGSESTEEYGITVAASLVKKYLDSGDNRCNQRESRPEQRPQRLCVAADADRV